MNYENIVRLTGVAKSLVKGAFTTRFLLQYEERMTCGSETITKSDYIPVTVWAGTGNDSFGENDSIRLSGKIVTQQYTDSNGNPKTTLEVLAKEIRRA